MNKSGPLVALLFLMFAGCASSSSSNDQSSQITSRSIAASRAQNPPYVAGSDTWFNVLTRGGYTEKNWKMTECGYFGGQKGNIPLEKKDIYLVGAQVDKQKQFIAEADGENIPDARDMHCPKIIWAKPGFDQKFPRGIMHSSRTVEGGSSTSCYYDLLGEMISCTVMDH